MKRWRLLEKRKRQQYNIEELYQEWNKSILDYRDLQDQHIELQKDCKRFQDKYIDMLKKCY